ncbi:hypothetical protein COL11_00420 [Bacillus anthracis]|nr:hypothetical protein CN337_20565 [Bacillus anthracis]PFW40510.1 hypothetical protein COL11_00420 [Bacillus anthracis]PGX31071.1 hypothetical protein COE33_09380 [Bacillus anthracis]
MLTPCSTTHPGRDYSFTGAAFDVTPVFAIESGTVLWSYPGYLGILSDNQENEPQTVTEYVHVQPNVVVNDRVVAGELIATLSQIGEFTGAPIPHVHINRLLNWQNPDICNHIFTCNWDIDGIGANQPPPSTATCPNSTGWSLVNGEWIYCQNGERLGGWHNGFFADSDGVWAGFILQANGNIQYRPRQYRNLSNSDPNVNTVAIGWVCSLGQFWYFDNNGNLVSNTNILQWNLGPNGACTNCGSCNYQT